MSTPSPFHLELKPSTRLAVIDVKKRIEQFYGGILDNYRRALYCSFHTTAGYLEESLCENIGHREEHLEPFITTFQKLFPPEADYRHDQMQLREELSEEQRKVEPKNADSHLIFIGAGMKNCVTYSNKPNCPVYFIDLDGVNGSASRCRHTTVLGYNEEKPVHQVRMAVPVSRHSIDSINLRDSRQDFFEQLNEMLKTLGISHGKIDIELSEDEHDAGVTVNEYETLLMQHDLREVLHNPLKYMAQKGYHALAEPQLIPGKTLDYAKYDLVQLFNKIIDALGVSETVVERLLSIFIRLPASHFLSMKRHITLFVSPRNPNQNGEIVFGKYQSPILVQWNRAKGETRHLDVKVSSFE